MIIPCFQMGVYGMHNCQCFYFLLFLKLLVQTNCVYKIAIIISCNMLPGQCHFLSLWSLEFLFAILLHIPLQITYCIFFMCVNKETNQAFFYDFMLKSYQYCIDWHRHFYSLCCRHINTWQSAQNRLCRNFPLHVGSLGH